MLKNIKLVIVCNGKRKTDSCLAKLEQFLINKVRYSVIKHYPFDSKEKKSIAKSNLVVVLGGDGTTLAVTRSILDFRQTRIIPVNFGTLGYMTTVAESELIDIVKNYLLYLTNELTSNDPKSFQSKSESVQIPKRYNFAIDERCLLLVKYKNKQYLCLNEIVLTHYDSSKSILIEIRINDEHLARFKGDGVILSTPTGSTAYNMSSGGPILAPNVDAMVLNAVSAHSLNLKPIVLSKKEKVKFYTPDKGVIVADGVKMLNMKEPVTCSISEEKLSFIKSIKENHIKVLKNKLNFGSNI